jgi:hypothetical protein
MSYTIRTSNENVYDSVLEYVRRNLSDEIRIASPRRRFISVENLTNDAIVELEDLGADIEETYQFTVDAATR